MKLETLLATAEIDGQQASLINGSEQGYPTHIPVLLEEVLSALQPRPGGTYIDCTVGLGGHSAAILHRSSPDGRLLAIDADPTSVAVARENLQGFRKRVTLVNGNFKDLAAIALAHGFDGIDGILLDLGPSSFQLGPMGRGFSFQSSTPLDMRYDPRSEVTASFLVNKLSERELADTLVRYGEERRARIIARHIARMRGRRPIATTGELARIVEEALGGRRGRLHPATKTFLALRLAVNQELDTLSTVLPQAVELSSPGGRLAVITFHSLEDRIVKNFIRAEARLKALAKKPIGPSEAEIRRNPRARSAKLRAAERL